MMHTGRVWRRSVPATVSRWPVSKPIGKSPIAEPIDFEADNLRRIFRVGEVVMPQRAPVSFYPPDTSTNERYDEYVATAIERLQTLTDMAAPWEGFTLLLENEKGIVTDTLARCEAVVKAIDHPSLLHLTRELHPGWGGRGRRARLAYAGRGDCHAHAQGRRA